MLPEAIMLLSSFVFSSVYMFSKAGIKRYDPTVFQAKKMLVGSVLVTILFLSASPQTKVNPDISLVLPFLGSVLGAFLAYNLFYRSLRLLDLSISGTVSSTAPFFSLLLAYLVLGESFSISKVLGALLISLGVYFLYRSNDLRTSWSLKGLGLAALAAVCWGSATVIWERSTKIYSVFFIAEVRVIFPTLLLLGVLLASRKVKALEFSDLKSWKLPALTSLFDDVIALVLFFFALQMGGVSRVAPLSAVTPFFVAALSAIFLRERITGRRWLGVLLVMAGIGLALIP